MVEIANPGASPLDMPFTVLVADDNPGVLEFTANAVRELGFRVVEAADAFGALERLAENPQISVLLTDVVMPAATGPELGDTALRARPDLKIIYMSGFPKNALGGDSARDDRRLLKKPFTLGELDRALRDCVGATPSSSANTGRSAADL